MAIAIISDTHLPRGSRRLTGACLERLRSADLILHAGDITTVHTFGQLKKLGPEVHAVAGNIDEEILREMLPVSLEVEIDGIRLAMIHDAGPTRGRLERLRARFPRATAVIFGHSHIPLLEGDETGFQIFNPGSPTDRRRMPRHTMGIAHLEAGAVRFEHVEL